MISPSESRVAKLRRGLMEEGLGGVLVVPGPNMRYFTGVNSLMLERPFMLFVPAEGEIHLVVPTLESGPYATSPLPMELHAWTDSEGPSDAISDSVKEIGMKGRWGVEGRAPFGYIEQVTKKAALKLISAEPIMQQLREIKDDSEARSLRRAGRVLSGAFEEFPDLIRAGVSEAEVAREATDLIYKHGAMKVDDMLVQSGPMSADPHHLPSGRKLGKGDSVVIDVGATYQGYYADITRTFCVGSAPEAERVYESVLEAQTAAMDVVAVGTRVGEVDSAARKVLKKSGMGANFFHRTGHGLGLEIHEEPYIQEGGKKRLKPGMCFTVEPGAYFSGKLGVRIEDNVIMGTKKGIAMTDPPKEFGWWD